MSAGTAGLQEPFKSNVDALVAASGGKVTVSSGFRTKAEQVALREQHGCGGAQVMNPACKGHPETAVPGTSQHEKGLAVDFGGDLDLVAQLATRYHVHRTISAEPWHYEPSDNISAADQQALAKELSGGGIDGFGGVDGIVHFFSTLMDPETWLRVLMVLGGLIVTAFGLAAITGDISRPLDIAAKAGKSAGAAIGQTAATTEAVA